MLAGQNLLFSAYPLSGIIIGGSQGRELDSELLAQLKPALAKFGQVTDLTAGSGRLMLDGAELQLFRRVKDSLDPDGVFGPLELDA